jgi:CheY-like chemotaxis protein
MKILIVEDNANVRRLIRKAIEDIADETFEREDGADALAAYEEHRPDIVLMDVKMPRLDGLSATRQILRFDPEAKIVIVTDYDDDEVRGAAHESGACAYAVKNNLTKLEDVILAART